MSTETETQQSPPPVTIVNRLGSIPIVASSLSTLHTTLASNAYTASPYTTASHLAGSAYGTAARYSAPLQTRLAPLIVRADGLANAAVDAVESRYPYPFSATPDDVVRDISARSDHAKDVANKTLDDNVRAPAGKVVAGIDQRFAPLVDYLETYVNKLTPTHSPTHSPTGSVSEAGSSAHDAALNGVHDAHAAAQTQYQRAYALSKQVRDGLYGYTNEQIRALQSQSVLVRRATATAQGIQGAAAGHAAAAQARVAALSDTMLAELRSIKAATQSLPGHLQSSFHTINKELSSTITDLAGILGDKELGTGEKVARVRVTVQERVQPLLDATTARLYDVLGAANARKADGKKKVEATYAEVVANGAEANGAVHEHVDAALANGHDVLDSATT